MKNIFVLVTAFVALGFSGCAAFRASVSDVDIEKGDHMRSTYDFRDMRKMTEEVVDEILQDKLLTSATTPPVMIVAGIENRTSRHEDMKGLSDSIRTLLIKSGKAKFVNEARREELLKEQGYQASNATPETQVKIGKQMGAAYMLTGSLMEMESRSAREIRLSRKKINYYKLTIEITNLETGMIDWTTEREFARKASLPLIGW